MDYKSYLKDPLVAGALGGFMKWIALRESPLDGLISIIGGAVCALYLRPFFQPFFEPVIGKLLTEQEDITALSAFGVGVGGIGLVGIIIDVFKFRRLALKRGDGNGA